MFKDDEISRYNSIKGCVIFECVHEHNINFCGECSEFHCNKVNERVYKPNVIKKWLEGNRQIKVKGINKYYDDNKDIPHYYSIRKNVEFIKK